MKFVPQKRKESERKVETVKQTKRKLKKKKRKKKKSTSNYGPPTNYMGTED